MFFSRGPSWVNYVFLITLLWIILVFCGYTCNFIEGDFDLKDTNIPQWIRDFLVKHNMNKLYCEISYMDFIKSTTALNKTWKLWLAIIGVGIGALIIDSIIQHFLFSTFTKKGKVAKMEISDKYGELQEKNKLLKEKKAQLKFEKKKAKLIKARTAKYKQISGDM